MRAWDILGIEPTDDVSTIKKAYSLKLRVHHPEDDPEGYQQLREAYDQAVKSAKKRIRQLAVLDQEETAVAEANANPVNSETSDSEIPPVYNEMHEEYEESADYNDIINKEFDASSPPSILRWIHVEDRPPDPATQLKVFLEEAEALYADFPSRIDADKWLDLLNSDIVWDATKQNIISAEMLDFLEKHYFLPRPIWRILETTFHLNDRALEDSSFAERYPKVHAYAIESPEFNLDYSPLLSAGDMDLEAYLRLRESGFASLSEGDLKTAIRIIEEALAMFAGDPDLLRLRFECYSQFKDARLALEACNDWLRIAGNNPEGYYFRARYLLEAGRPKGAMLDVERLLLLAPNENRTWSVLGKCQLKLGNLEQAREAFERILDRNAHDIEAGIYLADIRRQLKQHRKAPLRRRLKLASGYLLYRSLLPLVLIAAIHLLILTPYISPNGESPWYRLTHLSQLIEQINPADPIEIHTLKDFYNLPDNNTNTVKLKLEHTNFMGIYEVEMEAADGNPVIQYRSARNVQDSDVFTRATGYLSIGHLEDAAIIVIATGKQAQTMHNEGSIEMEGLFHPSLMQEMQVIVEDWKEKSEDAARHLNKHEIADIYVDSRLEPKAPPTDEYVKLRGADSILLLLIPLYILFLAEIRLTWRYIRFTGEGRKRGNSFEH
ncbi:J domain-containing protein [Paenibacillus radicis (ex Gao et al. 2016)]|uniref:J domain-containing protein n=1 Tax=Paenibacillus radicis (ex Gao et al. 2016) TaxID=1737354 RepID=A0A917H346_9BACL|nr:J domain-containing protein [Paenibacillus radicis (ex Gao et al. 2016)]GGG65498.1 hypothetical protein GCM10010918_19660 [Paenibacillus radicis (ex Gao et al. 2016)]